MIILMDGEAGEDAPHIPGPAGATGAAGTGGSANITPDTHPASPTIYDDEFEVGTSIDTAGTRFSGASPWTWTNQGTASTTVSEGSLTLTGQNVSGISHNILSQPIAGATWSYTCKMAASNVGGASEAGMLVMNSSGAFITFDIFPSSGPAFLIQNFNSPTSFGGSTYVSSGNVPGGGAYMSAGYLQLVFDGTTLFFNFSPSGVPGTFVTVFSQAAATFLGTPTRIGLNIDSTGTNLVAAFDWFRKTG
jgi:hypothetical protein